MQTYTIKLPEFEGPFDLLLFFIERDELDIHNIPIAKITSDFLDFLRQLEAIDIEVASEFIFVASSLLQIKSRMMLPMYRNNQPDPEHDPRSALVEQLIEYKRYRDTLPEFRQKEEFGMKLLKRGNAFRELEAVSRTISGEAELENLTLFKLLHTFERVMERYDKKGQTRKHPILNYPYSMEEVKQNVTDLLIQSEKLHALKIFEKCNDRLHAIFTFLALLELIQAGTVLLLNGEGINNFYVSAEPVSSSNIS